MMKTIKGICKKDGKKCNSESLVCHLNPTILNPTYKDLGETEDRPFYNKICSNFKKIEKVK